MANELVEQLQRQFISALKAQHICQHWVDSLPLFLLGIRTSIKEDLSYTIAELLYGTTLYLPGEFVSPCGNGDTDPATFVTKLKANMLLLGHRQEVTVKLYLKMSSTDLSLSMEPVL